jgi:hypothetical protein
MADTLEKIYDNTLTDSSFDSNGEATIITTDSSTRHVIKDIKIIEGDADIPISGKLQENGHDLVGLTANSSGSEIIGTSSTVKVKTSNVPLNYVDHEVSYSTSSTNVQTLTEPTVNGIGSKSSTSTTDNAHSNWTQDSTWRQYWPNIGSSENDVYLHNNNNSTHRITVRNSSGSEIYNFTTSYRPHYFDGSRYIYYMSSQYLYQVDAHSSSPSNNAIININASQTYSTNPKMFGYKDEWIIGWSTQTANAYIFDLTNNSVRQLSGNQSNVFNFGARNAGIVKKKDGTFYIIEQNGNNGLNAYLLDPVNTDYGTSSVSPSVTVSLATAASDSTGSYAYVGSRVYYVGGSRLNFVDFETDTPTQGSVSTSHSYSQYGYDCWGTEATPDASTISGRTYNITPSLKLRITGVTSA